MNSTRRAQDGALASYQYSYDHTGNRLQAVEEVFKPLPPTPTPTATFTETPTATSPTHPQTPPRPPPPSPRRNPSPC